MAKLKYLGYTRTNQNASHEDIRNTLHSGNPYYLSVRNLLPSLPSGKVNIKIYKTTLLPTVLD
jgi:hypothetical protein